MTDIEISARLAEYQEQGVRREDRIGFVSFRCGVLRSRVARIERERSGLRHTVAALASGKIAVPDTIPDTWSA